jgi:hypothetical protein
VSSEKLPSISIYFRFYGESFDPKEITQRLHVEPTIQFQPGDPIVEGLPGRRTRNGWMVKIGPLQTIEIQAMLDELKTCVNIPGTVVRQACIELDVEAVIVCGVLQPPSTPSPHLKFPPEFLEWASALGASIEIDVIEIKG